MGVLRGVPVRSRVLAAVARGSAFLPRVLARDASAICAPTFTVTSGADSGADTLREGVAVLCDGGTINIAPATHDITLTSVGNSNFGPTALSIDKTMTI